MAQLLYRNDLLAHYALSSARLLGESLFAMVDANVDEGLAGDRWLSQRRAEDLGLQDWFEWRRLDQLPPGFRHAWE